MDPRSLSARLADLGVPDAGSSLADPAAALRALEDRADRDPTDRRLAHAVVLIADRVALDAIGPAPAGVVRERLIRWDGTSATFAGTDARGRPAHVRVLRPELAREAVLRRQLVRDGRALLDLVPVEIDTDTPALRLALTGAPISPRRGDALARPLLTALAALARWEARGLAMPPLTADEVRVDLATGDAAIVCLTPTDGRSTAGIASVVARLVDPDDDGDVAAALRALAVGPDRVDDAARAVRSALAGSLARRRHALVAGWRDTWHRSREVRLHDAVQGLVRAVPPPAGRGAVGVDLDGRITVVEAGASSVVWGPVAAPPPPEPLVGEVVFDAVDGFRPPVARRLLRARAASPPNPMLDARVGGDAAATDAICRWVAAGLKLRTVRMLLERDRA